MSNVFGPYSPVRQAGNQYFISGQVGVDPDTKTAATGVESQTRQALTNMKKLLEGNELDMNDVVKTNIYVTDMDDFATINSVYETFFESPRPARSTVQVASIPKVAGDTKLLVEIEAIAYKES